MPVTRKGFVDEARTWLGTPYRHQGRLKGVACDCIGLVICTARVLGLSEFEILDYGKRPDGRLRQTMEGQLSLADSNDVKMGDIVLFSWKAQPIHVAIMTGADSLIHAYLPSRAVVEHRIDDDWRRQIVGCYIVPGIE